MLLPNRIYQGDARDLLAPAAESVAVETGRQFLGFDRSAESVRLAKRRVGRAVAVSSNPIYYRHSSPPTAALGRLVDAA